MKKLIFLIYFVLLNFNNFSQTVQPLPIPISFGSAEVWGDSIYYFGGSNNYSGTELYKRIYKYDGTTWSYYDTIPFNHVWSFSTSIKGDTIYVFCGWPSGANKLYMYRISTKSWQALSSTPSNSGFSNYGQTIEYYNGKIYAFYNGYVQIYNILTNSWQAGQTISSAGSWLASTIYNNEIYLAGWSVGIFYKYNPQTNQWTQLQSLPSFRSGGSFRSIDNQLYYVGGYLSSGAGNFQTTFVYDPVANQWSNASVNLSSKRAYMTDVLYKNKFYILGGLDEQSNPVNIVEYIMDQTTGVEESPVVVDEFILEQNYPNPFNPSTKIRYSIPRSTEYYSVLQNVTLKVYDVLGNEVATLVNEEKPAGTYEVEFNGHSDGGQNLSSGVYFYKLQAGSNIETKKMTLVK